MHMAAVAMVELGKGLVVAFQLAQRRDQPCRVAGEVDTADIGQRLAPPGQGQTDQRADDERHHAQQRPGHEDQCHCLLGVLASWPRVDRAAPDDAGHQTGHADQRADNEDQPDVVVLDVTHLVPDHTLELLTVHHRQQTCRGRDSCLVRADAGGEGVRRGIVDDVDRGL